MRLHWKHAGRRALFILFATLSVVLARPAPAGAAEVSRVPYQEQHYLTCQGGGSLLKCAATFTKIKSKHRLELKQATCHVELSVGDNSGVVDAYFDVGAWLDLGLLWERPSLAGNNKNYTFALQTNMFVKAGFAPIASVIYTGGNPTAYCTLVGDMVKLD